MKLTTTEKIKLVLGRRGITAGELADLTGQSRQNLSNKMKRDNYSVTELEAMARAMGVEVEIIFTMPDGTKI